MDLNKSSIQVLKNLKIPTPTDMILHLSKEVYESSVRSDGHQLSKRYSIFDGEKLVGFFYSSPEECYFSYNGTKIKLNIKKSLLGLPRISIVNEQTNETIGKYKLTNWVIFIGYSDKILVGHDVYKFKQIGSDVKFPLFKKDTWGQYKFRLSNGTDEIIYTFKLDIPFISAGNTLPRKAFEGSIDFTGTNKLILFAGCYLIERALENSGDSL